jgi:UDP:flavonoid glycosyltransferase YjiC (YdhE family)
MPYAFDQPDNASRVTRIGTGLCLSRRHYRADKAAKRLEKLLDSSGYGERARDAGQHVSRENGASVACDTVERAMARLLGG